MAKNKRPTGSGRDSPRTVLDGDGDRYYVWEYRFQRLNWIGRVAMTAIIGLCTALVAYELRFFAGHATTVSIRVTASITVAGLASVGALTAKILRQRSRLQKQRERMTMLEGQMRAAGLQVPPDRSELGRSNKTTRRQSK